MSTPNPGLGGPHDVGGVHSIAAVSLATQDRDYSYWERQTHALAVWLINHRLMSVDELRRGVEGLPDDAYAGRGYYEKWAASIAAILVQRGAITRADIEEELGVDDGRHEKVAFAVGDSVTVRGEDEVRRWRRPHLRVPGYLHGATGKVVEVLGAFDNPSYAAFGEGTGHKYQQPLYRVVFESKAVWGAVTHHDHDHDHHDEDHHEVHDTLEADIFQPWLTAGTAVGSDAPATTSQTAPYLTDTATAEVDHGDHKHSSRVDTECTAVTKEPEDPPLRPLATALVRLLATPGRPTQAVPRDGAPAGSVPLTREALARMVEALDDKMKAGLGARIVARAWADRAFEARLLADAPKAARELGIATSNYGAAQGGADVSLYPTANSGAVEPALATAEKPNEGGNLGKQIERFTSGHTHLIVAKQTPEEHHLVVCTLCSCYPAAVLGLSPEWYKSRYFRARAVRDPRGILRDEFGLVVPPAKRMVVHDSTAEVRYFVLPERPEGTDGWTEEQLAGIVTRDSMLGVGVCRADAPRAAYAPPGPEVQHEE